VVYQWITLAGALISLPLALVAWRARPKPGADPLVVVMLAIAAWNATEFLATITPSLAWSVYWARLHFVGLTLVVPAVFAVVLEYAGREDLLTRRTIALLLVEPIVVNALVWTSGHDLFIRYVGADAPAAAGARLGGFAATGVVPVDPGPVFWLHAAYAWLLAFASLLLVGWLALRRRDIYRGQLGLLGAAIVVPLTASVVDNLGPVSVRLTEPGFVVTALLLTVAVARFDFVDLTPVARATVLSGLSSGLLVVDRDDRVTDCNRTARRMFALGDEGVIGASLESAFAHVPDVYERYADMRTGEETVAVETAGGARHFRVQVTPLTDRRDRYLGRVFLVDDVTERYERRVQLERQNEHLDRFASVVSHDLRNPLQVANGHVTLAYDADDDTEHLAEIERSHDRMETIIDDVLTMARQGQTIEETRATDLAAVAEAAWAGVDTDSATLVNDLSGTVESDEGRLQQAFENLFRNAVEHGSGAALAGGDRQGEREGGVTVHTGLLGGGRQGVVDPDQRGFFVADDGEGVPPGKRDQVFEAGYTEGEDGTGLGLSIVTSIVDAHGWDIDATESEDGGARFEITGVDVLDASGGGAEEV
jgi:PAS domain S-box-containing protein